MNTRPGIVIAALLAGVSLAAQQRPPVPPDQRPPVTFRSEINFVEIDASVTDRDGRFVSGLTQDDFQILEEGRPQRISAFDLVHIPITRDPAPAVANITLEPETVSNRQPVNGRIFLLLLDDLQTDLSRTRFVRGGAREFIDRHVASNDLVAVAFTSGRSFGQDFTSSRARLRAAIERFAGTKLPSKAAAMIAEADMKRYELVIGEPPIPQDPHANTRLLHAKTSLEVLEKMSRFLGGIRGRRKALVYFGEGIDRELIDIVSIDPQPRLPQDAAGVRDAMREAVAAATRANVTVYAVDPRGLSTGMEGAIALPTMTLDPNSPLSERRLTEELARSHLWMRSISEETGGLAFLNSNDVSSALSRIVEDSSSYYILGYYGPAGRKKQGFRRVEVRVNRPGLTVRARPGYYLTDTEPAEPPSGAAARSASPELREALRSPLLVSDLTFSASVTPFRGADGKASVVLNVEIDPDRLRFSSAGGSQSTEIELYVVATDPVSKTPGINAYHGAKLQLRPQTLDAVRKEGVRIMHRLELGPGRYRVQFGVRDRTSGAVGTLFSDVDVPNFFEAPLTMSGIVVVSAAATRTPTVEPDRVLSQVLPGAPTSRREFPANDTLAAFAEIYDNDLRAPHRVLVKTTIRNAAGKEVFAAHAEERSEDFRGLPADKRAFGHRIVVPAATLGPGDYLLRIQAIRSADQKGMARELTFTVR